MHNNDSRGYERREWPFRIVRARSRKAPFAHAGTRSEEEQVDKVTSNYLSRPLFFLNYFSLSLYISYFLFLSLEISIPLSISFLEKRLGEGLMIAIRKVCGIPFR